ncbi:MAG: TetR/AcrR family transcriptional regulator [Fusobacteria bacterium]|nr:TetR/AcrR family transcriptional regulator [Fusobacteriota bacterium]
MPKIIEGIEKKVIKVSGKLFLSEFYLNVDARTIAKEVGVSVGTLYNYFPTKQDIFLAVVDKKFEKIECELVKLLKEEGSFEERIYAYIKKLYLHTESAMNLHRSLAYLFIIEDEVVLKHIESVHKSFQNIMRNTVFSVVIEKYPNITESELGKILTVIRSSIFFFIKQHREKKADFSGDVKMLYEIFIGFLKSINCINKGEINE